MAIKAKTTEANLFASTLFRHQASERGLSLPFAVAKPTAHVGLQAYRTHTTIGSVTNASTSRLPPPKLVGLLVLWHKEAKINPRTSAPKSQACSAFYPHHCSIHIKGRQLILSIYLVWLSCSKKFW